MTSRTNVILTVCLVSLLSACGKHPSRTARESGVVVAIAGDVDSFNPLFAEEIAAGEINDLLFPALVGSRFDMNEGALQYTPMLAASWDERSGGKDIVFHLLAGARWADGKPVVARDVQLSYELYGDSTVASVRQSAVEGLRLTNGTLDVAQSVEAVNDSTVVFHFAQASANRLFDAGLPILPSHIFDTLPRADLRTNPINRTPVGAGPFALQEWIPLQEIILRSSSTSILPHPARLPELIFRVIPDYNSRVAQLRSGEVDVVSELRPEDARSLEADSAFLRVVSMPGRDYDFIGWNNIDPVVYDSTDGNVILPHPLFGSARVRRALTMAINRPEIVAGYLGSYGQQAFGGVSPLFRWAYNDTLTPLPFDPQRARRLLAESGWVEKNGILEKGGRRFEFVLTIPSGNQLRMAIATVVQQELRNIGISMQIEQVERATFWQQIIARKYDAWIAGFSVPLQMELDDLWGSDLASHPFNLTGFRNARVDRILRAARELRDERDGAPLWKEFQVIIREEQPCTFLYWMNTLVGVNRRVHGTHIGVLGTTHEAWEWYIEDSSLARSATE